MAQLLFGGTTKKKLCGNFLTSPFMQKMTKLTFTLLTVANLRFNSVVDTKLPVILSHAAPQFL